MPVFGTPQPGVVNVAAFQSDTYNYDPLLASETISQSAKIAPSLGVLLRGTVLYGPTSGSPLTTATNLTTVATGAFARAILAQDIDTGTGAAVTGLIYTAGSFLDTAMIFGSKGALQDSADLWLFDIHVLTVEQRSGKLVPMISLPATGGPMPQVALPEDEVEMSEEDRKAIADLRKKMETASPEEKAKIQKQIDALAAENAKLQKQIDEIVAKARKEALVARKAEAAMSDEEREKLAELRKKLETATPEERPKLEHLIHDMILKASAKAGIPFPPAATPDMVGAAPSTGGSSGIIGTAPSTSAPPSHEEIPGRK
jgi:hypothetical protein